MNRVQASSLFSILLLFAFIPLLHGEDNSCSEAGCTPSVVNQKNILNETIKDLTFEEFAKLKKSSEKFILVDVRPHDSFMEGHIDGAISFPLQEIVAEVAQTRLSKDEKIIVYCGSANCGASTVAALKLKDLGYDVLHYKGGVKEWMEKGNALVKD